LSAERVVWDVNDRDRWLYNELDGALLIPEARSPFLVFAEDRASRRS